jgi:hypothetical protein
MDEEDGRYLAETLQVLTSTGEWTARTDAAADRLRPAPGSELREDDDQANPYHVSHAAWRSLSTAVDHLGCLRVLLGDAKTIHMYAPFTLVRAALENGSAAVWMLQPPQREERLARRLRFAVEDIRNGERARKLTGQTGPRTEQERIDQIRAIADGAGLDAAALKERATYSEIIQAVDTAGNAGHRIEMSWKVCSGFAHGDMWATLAASRRTQMPSPAEEGIGTFKIEANLSLLMNMTRLAVTVTRTGWQLFDRRSLPPS